MIITEVFGWFKTIIDFFFTYIPRWLQIPLLVGAIIVVLYVGFKVAKIIVKIVLFIIILVIVMVILLIMF